ncbi:MAG: serine/threonine protein kinase, partial [bacterium]
ALVASFLPRESSRPSPSAQRYLVGSADLQVQSEPVFSPDGQSIVYSVREGSTRRLHRRRLGSFESVPIEGTEDGSAPFFSPDGAWLGFVTSTAIKKVPAGGGVAQTILEEARVDAGDWAPDGTIYYSPRSGGADGRTALARVASTGGKSQVVASIDTTLGETEAWCPDVLPDGRTVLITLSRNSDPNWTIVAVRPDGSRVPLLENALISNNSRAGQLLYVDYGSGAVLAAPFDAAKLRITGPAIPLTEPVNNNYCFGISDDGKLVYVPQPGAGQGDEIAWFERNGRATRAMETRGPWMHPRVSPDGRKVLLRKVGDQCELWILDVGRGVLSRAVQTGDNHDAVWSPDGRSVVTQQLTSPPRMVTISVEGAREVVTLAQGTDPGSPQSWSAAGNRLAYAVHGPGTRSDIWIRSMGGGAPPAAYLASSFNETDPDFSPDGNWMAYASDEAGSPEIFIRRYPDDGTIWQVSVGGGSGPRWSRDGRELYFVSGTRMMAATVQAGPTLEVGTPVVLFDGGFSVARARDYDVAPDGRFIALLHSAGASGQKELR